MTELELLQALFTSNEELQELLFYIGMVVCFALGSIKGGQR